MHAPDESRGSRLCPSCEATEPVAPGAPLWPVSWECSKCGHVIPASDGIPQYAPELANSLSGFDPALFDQLALQEPGNFWFEPRTRLLVGLARRFFPKAKRYLEIGCGTGAVLAPMAASRPWLRVVGAELHPAGLVHARKRLGRNAEFVQMDARKIPAREAFDLVGTFDVLEHIPEDEAVLSEIRKSLVPGGGLLAAVPQHPALWSETDDVAQHVRRYRRGELQQKLRKFGFEILFSSSYTSTLLPLMFASRILSRRGNGAISRVSHREFNLNPLLNASLRSTLYAEVALTLKGIRWPVGGSRIVVARRPLDS